MKKTIVDQANMLFNLFNKVYIAIEDIAQKELINADCNHNENLSVMSDLSQWDEVKTIQYKTVSVITRVT